MAKSRLRPKRAKYKKRVLFKHFGWSKGKTLAIVVMMALLIAFILFVLVALFVTRQKGN